MGSAPESEPGERQLGVDQKALYPSAGTMRLLRNLLNTSPHGVEVNEQERSFRRHVSQDGKSLSVEAQGFESNTQQAHRLANLTVYHVPQPYQDLKVVLQARMKVRDNDNLQHQTQYDFWEILGQDSESGGVVIISDDQRYFKLLHEVSSKEKTDIAKQISSLIFNDEVDEDLDKVLGDFKRAQTTGFTFAEGYKSTDQAFVLDAEGALHLSQLLIDSELQSTLEAEDL